MEDRSGRNNMCMDGIDEKPNETWDECEARVQELIEVNLGITDTIEFDRCHEYLQKQILPKMRIVQGQSFVK